MRLVLSFIWFFIFAVGFGQDLPKNPETGKCYEKCFDYEVELEWREVSCDSLKWRTPGEFTIKGEEAADIIKKRAKFKVYQAKLIKLGYDLEVTGRLDDKTIKAHHQYLKYKKKAAKQEAKKLKKAIKDSLKQIKLQNKRSQKEF